MAPGLVALQHVESPGPGIEPCPLHLIKFTTREVPREFIDVVHSGQPTKAKTRVKRVERGEGLEEHEEDARQVPLVTFEVRVIFFYITEQFIFKIHL